MSFSQLLHETVTKRKKTSNPLLIALYNENKIVESKSQQYKRKATHKKVSTIS